jgi:type IV pilus assembly protein PilW
MHPLRMDRGAAGRQAGMALIELLVAMTIALFMMAGLLTLVYGTRQNFLAQNGLAQLQDNERLALTLITNVVQSAGYFPDPLVETAAAALPATATFPAAGQSLTGTTSATAPGDTITVRYKSGATDGLMDCTGAPAAGTTPVSTFSVNNSNQLVCTVNGGNAQPLIAGVQNLAIFYGVDTNADGSADQYISANAMAAANWTSVVSVQVTLTFTNPLAGQPGQPATISLARTIPILNKT